MAWLDGRGSRAVAGLGCTLSCALVLCGCAGPDRPFGPSPADGAPGMGFDSSSDHQVRVRCETERIAVLVDGDGDALELDLAAGEEDFLVLWTQQRAGEGRVLARTLRDDGSLSAEWSLLEADAHSPAVAVTASGFLAVWLDGMAASSVPASSVQVRARALGVDGVPLVDVSLGPVTIFVDEHGDLRFVPLGVADLAGFPVPLRHRPPGPFEFAGGAGGAVLTFPVGPFTFEPEIRIQAFDPHFVPPGHAFHPGFPVIHEPSLPPFEEGFLPGFRYETGPGPVSALPRPLYEVPVEAGPEEEEPWPSPLRVHVRANNSGYAVSDARGELLAAEELGGVHTGPPRIARAGDGTFLVAWSDVHERGVAIRAVRIRCAAAGPAFSDAGVAL